MTEKCDISAQWSNIPFSNISLHFFFVFFVFNAHALIIDKSNSSGKDTRSEQTLSNH